MRTPEQIPIQKRFAGIGPFSLGILSDNSQKPPGFETVTQEVVPGNVSPYFHMTVNPDILKGDTTHHSYKEPYSQIRLLSTVISNLEFFGAVTHFLRFHEAHGTLSPTENTDISASVVFPPFPKQQDNPTPEVIPGIDSLINFQTALFVNVPEDPSQRKLHMQGVQIYMNELFSLPIHKNERIKPVSISIDSLEQLKQLDKNLKFIGHEVSTPLTALYTSAQFLQHPDLDEKTKKNFLQGISIAGQQLLQVKNAIPEMVTGEYQGTFLSFEGFFQHAKTFLDSDFNPYTYRENTQMHLTEALQSATIYWSPFLEYLFFANVDRNRADQTKILSHELGIPIPKESGFLLSTFQVRRNKDGQLYFALLLSDNGGGLEETAQANFLTLNSSKTSEERKALGLKGGKEIGMSEIARLTEEKFQGYLVIENNEMGGATITLGIPLQFPDGTIPDTINRFILPEPEQPNIPNASPLMYVNDSLVTLLPGETEEARGLDLITDDHIFRPVELEEREYDHRIACIPLDYILKKCTENSLNTLSFLRIISMTMSEYATFQKNPLVVPSHATFEEALSIQKKRAFIRAARTFLERGLEERLFDEFNTEYVRILDFADQIAPTSSETTG